ncbi:lipase 3-like [Coccinella septempunctata]|uniref:lipase 3-like n=1 Tax=Coccinella septempunctata TaxID=41139 RepID=UPI001D065D9F|nr:lipase 3-like [Coccinella septempunctata]XP_044749501.1 lipase 3-like [Coccinella septempunctata]XP_044749502.1 lipase 3-like [Coccinella septempunctata]XP_044749503.1 lipase 3-like [Coccinella septempunctata]
MVRVSNRIVFVVIVLCGSSHFCSGLSDEKDWKFDPDEELDTLQIIRRHGYPSESHIVETEDGYLLTLHRIPGSKNGSKEGQPILLQHGLLSSSSDWVDEGNKSLSFALADQGYDVWLGNARGNHYSIGHISFRLDSEQFWNFSWHEMGVYDLPAVIQFISTTTGKGGQILYVGHSMGTTMFYVFSSLKPEIAKLVKFMVSLAPVAYMKYVRSPIRYLTPFVNEEQWIAEHLGIKRFLPDNKILKLLTYECEMTGGGKICENLIFILCGADKEEYNENIMPIVLQHVPAGSSTKAVLHYGQEIKSDGNFQQYDYGPAGNLKQYGTESPPMYNLSNIEVPIYLMYSYNDFLASPIDVVRMSKKLVNLAGMYSIPLKKFNHVDFLFGKDAFEVVYQPLIKVLKNYTQTEELEIVS